MTQTPVTQNLGSGTGTVPPGMRHIEFILSADFTGTINGASVAGTGGAGVPAVGVYAIDAPAGDVLSGMNYAITAGAAILTTY